MFLVKVTDISPRNLSSPEIVRQSPVEYEATPYNTLAKKIKPVDMTHK
jgi:hypothetical protein